MSTHLCKTLYQRPSLIGLDKPIRGVILFRRLIGLTIYLETYRGYKNLGKLLDIYPKKRYMQCQFGDIYTNIGYDDDDEPVFYSVRNKIIYYYMHKTPRISEIQLMRYPLASAR